MGDRSLRCAPPPHTLSLSPPSHFVRPSPSPAALSLPPPQSQAITKADTAPTAPSLQPMSAKAHRGRPAAKSAEVRKKTVVQAPGEEWDMQAMALAPAYVLPIDVQQ